MERAQTILVVEDARDIRHILTLVFEDAGYRVVEAADGEAALQAASANSLALVTLDLSLPDIDGLEVLSRLRSDPKTRALPVIIISAYTPRVPEEQRAQVQAIVSKPFDLDDLMLTVERIVGPP